MKMKLFAAALASVAGLVGGSAHAAQYLLNVDGCSGGCGHASYGTINVSGEGSGTLTIDIELTNGAVIFQEAGPNPHDEIWFNTNTSSATIGGLAAPFTSNGLQAAGSNQANGASFGTWDYVIDRAHDGNPSTPATGQHSLTFTVSGPASLALDADVLGGQNVFFVVDIASYNATSGAIINTGRVGATLVAGVPEPATWGLMIAGFGGMGAMLRRRRTAFA